MQVGDVLSFSPTHTSSSAILYTEISSKITHDFGAKMKLASPVSRPNANKVDDLQIEAHVTSLTLDEKFPNQQLHDDDDDDVTQEDEEFSFVCTNPNGSPISADDAFYNGQIRPVYPVFNRELLFTEADDHDPESEKARSLRPPLRKIFVEKHDTLASSSSEAGELEGAPQGTYCEWSPRAVESSPELGKKSNSTGFSKLWRFRDLVHRSSSDGKDAFVFLSNPAAATTTNSSKNKAEKNDKVATEKRSSGEKVNVRGKQVNRETVSSAHERHYVRNRAKKEVDKRRSYLPYRQDLVGIFTSVNGLSKNVHPF